jgi:Stress responsive A/B Barrel Domain
MIRHTVMLRWKPGTTPADIAAATEGLGGLPGAIPEIREYHFGHDIGVNSGNFDFVVVADFADTDDYVAYRDHPLHRAIIAERILPHVAERAAVQFDTD